MFSFIRNKIPLLFSLVVFAFVSTPFALPSLLVEDIENYRVFQRDIGGTSKSIMIKGSFTEGGLSDTIDAQILSFTTSAVVVDWTPIDTVSGPNSLFTGTVRVPQGGWYKMLLRGRCSEGILLPMAMGSNKWGVGMNILCIGQSNMVGCAYPPFVTVTNELAANYSNAAVWEKLADPYDDDSPTGAIDNDNWLIQDNNVGGSMVPVIANELASAFSFPIAFVPAALGGSRLTEEGWRNEWSYRNAANPFDTTTLYGNSINKARRAGGVEIIIMNQGESDVDGHTEQEYKDAFDSMVTHYRTDVYSNIPIFYSQLGRAAIGNPESKISGIRNAQMRVDNGITNFLACAAMDIPLSVSWDPVHYKNDAFALIGARMANAIKFYFAKASYYRGPSISDAFFTNGDRNQLIVKILHRGGNNFTPDTGITGFEVLSGTTIIPIVKSEKYSIDTILITLSSSIPNNEVATLRYLFGIPTMQELARTINDNSALKLPLESTVGAVPIINKLLPIITVSATDALSSERNVDETQNGALFTFSRTLTDAPLTVWFKISGTAGNGSDYLQVTDSVTFESGVATALAPIFVVDDAISEIAENITFTIIPKTNYLIGVQQSATVSLLDNEPVLPMMSVSAEDSIASEDVGDTGVFIVSRTDNITGSLQVYYNITGSASNGADYTMLSGVATIPDNESFVAIPVRPINDAIAEGAEKIHLIIIANSAYHILGTTQTDSITIIDNDITQYIWNSYDAEVQSTGAMFLIPDSTGNQKNAKVGLYLSQNDNGVLVGDIPRYVSINHPITGWKIASLFWAYDFYIGSDNYYIPFYGKSAIARGSDDSEANTPLPIGKFDIELHPVDNEKLQVAAFIAPLTGSYSLSNFAARMILTGASGAQVKCFGKNKSLLATLSPTNNCDWVTYAQTINLGELNEGDSIYFAADRGEDNSWGMDALEMAWTITASTVNNNRSPVIASIGAKTVLEESLLEFPVATSDPDGNLIYLQVQNLPAGAQLSGGVFSWYPTYLQAGVYSVTFIASDGLLSDTQTVSITVVNVNRAPAISSVAPTIATEDVQYAYTPSAADADGNALVWSVKFAPTSMLLNSTNGAISWVPVNGELSSGEILLICSDNGSPVLSDTQSITIMVNPVNDKPIAIADSFFINEDSILTITAPGILANDTDIENDTLVSKVVSTTVHGILRLDSNGSFTYTPQLYFHGIDSFTYGAKDAIDSSEIVTVIINIASVNNPPVLNALKDTSITEGDSISFLVSASDPDATPITIVAESLPTGSSFELGVFRFRPTFSQAGTYPISFIATDGLLSDTQTLTITVKQVVCTLSVEMSVGGIVDTLSPRIVPKGGYVTVAATPDSGFAFSKWIVSSGQVTLCERYSEITECILDSGNATINAEFVALGSLFIANADTSASVFLCATNAWQGKFSHKGNGLISGLKPGKYLLLSTSNKNRPYFDTVCVNAAKTDTISFSLSPTIPLAFAEAEPLLSGGFPISTGSINSAIIEDFDKDGDGDLLIAKGDGSFLYYTNTTLGYTLEAGPLDSVLVPYVVSDGIAAIRVVDWFLNNTLDLLVSSGTSLFVLPNISKTGALVYGKPISLFTSSNISLSGFDCYNKNSDSIPDLILGFADGSIKILESSSASSWQTPKWEELQTPTFNDSIPLTVDNDAAPCMIDISGDGKLDLLLGSGKGSISYFKALDNGNYFNKGELLVNGKPVAKSGSLALSVAYSFKDTLPKLIFSDRSGQILKSQAFLKGDFSKTNSQGNSIIADGIVDVLDLSLFGDAWGTTQTDALWDWQFNLDQTPTADGLQVIDVMDLSVFGDCWLIKK